MGANFSSEAICKRLKGRGTADKRLQSRAAASPREGERNAMSGMVPLDASSRADPRGLLQFSMMGMELILTESLDPGASGPQMLTEKVQHRVKGAEAQSVLTARYARRVRMGGGKARVGRAARSSLRLWRA